MWGGFQIYILSYLILCGTIQDKQKNDFLFQSWFKLRCQSKVDWSKPSPVKDPKSSKMMKEKWVLN